MMSHDDKRHDAVAEAGNRKAADDSGNYPANWTSEQRTKAYWESRRMDIIPDSPAAWESVARHRHREVKRRQEIISDEAAPF